MKKKLVAKRYAEALFALVIEKENSALQSYADALWCILRACDKNTMLSAVFNSPLVTEQEKLNVLYAVARRYTSLLYFINFCTLLIKTQRIHVLNEIAMCYQDLVNKYQGRVIVKIVTAYSLDEEDKYMLRTSLSSLGKQVDITYEVDPSLLGGMILTIGDLYIDASLRKELNTICTSIIKGGCYGN